MPLLLLFIGLLILEIYVLLKVHTFIGTMPTILMVIFTAFAGVWLLKQQGFAMLGRYQSTIMSGKIPAQEMLEGVALVFGGALLLTPGFVTDTVGFLCLIPFTRKPIIRWLMARFGGYIKARTTVLRPDQPAGQPSSSGRVFEDTTRNSGDDHDKT